MSTQSVTIKFTTEADSQSLTACLEQILRNLNLKTEEASQG